MIVTQDSIETLRQSEFNVCIVIESTDLECDLFIQIFFYFSLDFVHAAAHL